LENAGVTLVRQSNTSIPQINNQIGTSIISFEAIPGIARLLFGSGSQTSVLEVINNMAGKTEKDFFQSGFGSPGTPLKEYNKLIFETKPALREAYTSYFDGTKCDVLIIPTTPLPARSFKEDEHLVLNGKTLSAMTAYTRNTRNASNAGQPAISIPVGLTSAGLPVGIELTGRRFDDRKLLAIAASVQSLFPVLRPNLDF